MLRRRQESKLRCNVPGKKRRQQFSPNKLGGTPDVVLEHARSKVQRFEEALKAMGDLEGPEVVYLRDALKRTRQVAQARPLASQITECRRFIERSEHRLKKINAEREAEAVQLEEARNRLARLEAQAAALPPEDPGRAPPGDVVAELEELKAKLVVTERERDEVLCAPVCKRQAMSRTALGREGTPHPIPDSWARLRLREDFVPMCDEDILRWMEDRQADMQDALSAGNGHEVARLCHVMGTAATSWSTPTLSMVSNAVQR